MTTRNHANLREGGTELERVAQNKLHEMLMIEYGFVTENVEPMKALLTTYAQKVAEEAVRKEREKWIRQVGEKIDLPTRKLLQNAFNEGVQSTKDIYNNALKNLTPLPDKE